MAALPICDELRLSANSANWEHMFILRCRREIAQDLALAREINALCGRLTRGVHGPRTGPNRPGTARTENQKLEKCGTKNRPNFFGSVLRPWTPLIRKQFSNNSFREWCDELKIKQNFTSVTHPQDNGQTEVPNRTILQGLKARLEKAKGQWVKELPNVLWA